MLYNDATSSWVSVSRGAAGAMALRSVRSRSCISGYLASRKKSQVTVSELVSEPANRKVLMLFRMSSSEIRWSGAMSTDTLERTRETISQASSH